MTPVAATLGDVLAGIEAGKSIQTLERRPAPEEPGILKVSAVSWGVFDASLAKAVSNDYKPPDSYKVRAGDLLFSRANTIELTGAVAIADQDYPNRYLSDKTFRLIPKAGCVLSQYLLYALRAPAARAHIEANAGGTSDSMRNIAQGAMLSIPLLLPDIETQHSVSQRLAAAFEEAAVATLACNEQVEMTERLRKHLLSESFPNPPVATNVPDEWSPPAWRWQRLLSLARLESGHTPSRRHPEWWDGDVPWLALPDIRKLHGKVAMQVSENTNALGLANSSARLLPANTVCVSRTASIGFVTVLGRPMATSQDFCNWICDPEKLDPEFLMYAFMAAQEALKELGSGAVHKTIYMPTIQSFHLCAPDLPEQRRIARRLRERLVEADTLRSRLKERLQAIEQLPRRILASAFGST